MGWDNDWAWSLPLIVGTLVFHVSALGCLAHYGQRLLAHYGHPPRRVIFVFAVTVAVTVLISTILIGFDAAAWACVYLILGASPTPPEAMLYSLSAITSYGHAGVFLKPSWQLMGALESVNGMLLFGLTTAFLFAAIQKVLPQKFRAE